MLSIRHQAAAAATAVAVVLWSAPGALADQYGCPNEKVQIFGSPKHGIPDNFSSSCKEPAKPSAGLQLKYPTAAADFDATSWNNSFIHTIANLPGGIVGAILEIRIRPLGEVSCNDGLHLMFTDGTGSAVAPEVKWGRRLGTGSGSTFCDATPGLVGSEWNTTNYPNGHTFLLDLCDLPLHSGQTGFASDLIPRLDQVKYLDILVSDDSAVDYVKLSVTHCCGGTLTIYGDWVKAATDLVPYLEVSGCCSPGGTIGLEVGHGIPGTAAFLAVGLGSGVVPIGGGNLLQVAPLASMIALPLDQDGARFLPAAIPPSAGGLRVYLQALVADPGNPIGVASTHAVEMDIH